MMEIPEPGSRRGELERVVVFALGMRQNDVDAGNGIETLCLWSACLPCGLKVRMMEIPDTGLRLSLRQRSQRVRQLIGLIAMWGLRRAAWIEQVE
jgi:hypothetical protein